MSAANRRRGAEAERSVVRWLREEGGYPDARRYLAGDGRQPGDVDFHALVCLEVKDVAESAWPTWCRQAAAEARDGMVPVVVRRTRGVADPGAWECRVQWSGWWGVASRVAPETWPDAHHFGVDMGEDVQGIGIVAAWCVTTLSEFIAALRRFDALDGAA